jgi:hypothetical protein
VQPPGHSLVRPPELPPQCPRTPPANPPNPQRPLALGRRQVGSQRAGHGRQYRNFRYLVGRRLGAWHAEQVIERQIRRRLPAPYHPLDASEFLRSVAGDRRLAGLEAAPDQFGEPAMVAGEIGFGMPRGEPRASRQAGGAAGDACEIRRGRAWIETSISGSLAWRAQTLLARPVQSRQCRPPRWALIRFARYSWTFASVCARSPGWRSSSSAMRRCCRGCRRKTMRAGMAGRIAGEGRAG